MAFSTAQLQHAWSSFSKGPYHGLAPHIHKLGAYHASTLYRTISTVHSTSTPTYQPQEHIIQMHRTTEQLPRVPRSNVRPSHNGRVSLELHPSSEGTIIPIHTTTPIESHTSTLRHTAKLKADEVYREVVHMQQQVGTAGIAAVDLHDTTTSPAPSPHTTYGIPIQAILTTSSTVQDVVNLYIHGKDDFTSGQLFQAIHIASQGKRTEAYEDLTPKQVHALLDLLQECVDLSRQPGFTAVAGRHYPWLLDNAQRIGHAANSKALRHAETWERKDRHQLRKLAKTLTRAWKAAPRTQHRNVLHGATPMQ